MNEHEELRAIVASTEPRIASADQIDRILQHAEGCAECAPPLRSYAARAVLARTPVVRLDPDRSARLRARVLAGATSRPAARVARPARRPSAVRGGGWLAAAALAVALLTHHGFHQPLNSGWLAAAAIALVALGVGVYAVAQRRRVATLEYEMRFRDGAGEPTER